MDIYIDLETYSDVPIADAGAHKYVESPSFEILLMSYAIDDGPVVTVDLAQGEQIPGDILYALADPAYIKHAYNAAFEWLCLSKYLGKPLPLEQWRCSRLHALYCGYPAGLDITGRALGLPQDARKLATGKALIKYFCVPTGLPEYPRRRPQDDPGKWQLFKAYNAQDVVAEREIDRKLSAFAVPDGVQRQWETDMRINARGVAVDMPLVSGALAIGAQDRAELTEQAQALTGMDNPRSNPQLRAWVQEQLGIDPGSLDKDAVTALLARDDLPEAVGKMLRLRQELGKTSTSKYDAIDAAVCADSRVRGVLQYYGANRTGRWAGRLVQVQNLPRTYLTPIDPARDLIKRGDRDGLRMLYGDVQDTLSQLIRTAFAAPEGHVLIDADYSAIEARVISWLAGEQWRLDVFKTHGKIYEASAAAMFGVPIERIVKGNPEYALRQKGKVAELALGFQGGPGALIRMGALDKGLAEEDLPDIVSRWRDANPRIRDLWYAVETAVKQTIQTAAATSVRGITWRLESDAAQGLTFLTAELPSGRKLYYVQPRLVTDASGRESIAYNGVNQTTRQWMTQTTYGGKLAENLVQAIARDCLAEAIERLEHAGLHVVMHIHDEVVLDVPEGAVTLDEVVGIMTQPMPWAPDLPLNADGWTGPYYKKE